MATKEELINFGERFLKMTKDSEPSISREFFEEALTLFKHELCILDDMREDFVSDVYAILDLLPTSEEASQIIRSFDRVTSELKHTAVRGISLDKVKQAREEIKNLTPWDDGLVEMHEVLSILDKLIESEE